MLAMLNGALVDASEQPPAHAASAKAANTPNGRDKIRRAAPHALATEHHSIDAPARTAAFLNGAAGSRLELVTGFPATVHIRSPGEFWIAWKNVINRPARWR
ncbi:MAG: hypothetical protein WCG92_15860 [Hyphomicrobiales bacterium]|nr:hypothetical protein [Alphaproteobacteria bacterium]